MLSDALWRSQFGGDPGAVGRDLRLDGQPYTVVGVMPRAFEALAPGVSLWRPLAFTPEEKSDAQRHSNNYWNIGRLKPGATLEQAQAQIDALNAANLERFPQYKELLINAGFHTKVERYPGPPRRGTSSRPCTCCGAARCFVLLIGCVNVANLVLVRARARAEGAGDAARARRAAVPARAAARDRERAADAGRGRRRPARRRRRAARRVRASTSRTCPTAARSGSTRTAALYALGLSRSRSAS